MRLTVKKGFLHLNSVWEEIIASFWHSEQGQYILQRLLNPETPNAVMFAVNLSIICN
jgi:hypothetical protein